MIDTILTLVSLTATFLSCFWLLYREIKALRADMRELSKQQSARTDKLIDLLKERR